MAVLNMSPLKTTALEATLVCANKNCDQTPLEDWKSHYGSLQSNENKQFHNNPHLDWFLFSDPRDPFVSYRSALKSVQMIKSTCRKEDWSEHSSVISSDWTIVTILIT